MVRMHAASMLVGALSPRGGGRQRMCFDIYYPCREAAFAYRSHGEQRVLHMGSAAPCGGDAALLMHMIFFGACSIIAPIMPPFIAGQVRSIPTEKQGLRACVVDVGRDNIVARPNSLKFSAFRCSFRGQL